MANTLSIAPRAEADLKEAFQSYEARLNLIARMPQIFRRRGPLHLLAKIDRFPYAIYFVWEEPQSHVAVRRVLHFAQDATRAIPQP